MCRGFIDHKGVLDEYTLTDGAKTSARCSASRTPGRSSKSFKVKNDRIVAVEATFVGAPYYIRSPFMKNPDSRGDQVGRPGSAGRPVARQGYHPVYPVGNCDR